MELQDTGRPGWHVGEYRGVDTVSQLAFPATPWKDAPTSFAGSALAIECGLSQLGQSECLDEVMGYLYQGRKFCHFDDLPELSILLPFVYS